MEKIDSLVKNIDTGNMGSSIIQHCKCRTRKNSAKKLLKKKLKNVRETDKSSGQSEYLCKDCNKRNSNNSSCSLTHSNLNKNNKQKYERNSKDDIEQSCLNPLSCSNVLLEDQSEINTLPQDTDCSTLESRHSPINDNSHTSKVLNESSCFPKLNCCRRPRQKYKKYDHRYENYYDDYKKLGQISPAMSTSCTATNSILTASSCITSLISQNSLSNFSQDLSISLSNDSGFDETPCLLKILYEDHTCSSNSENCFKRNNYFLNLHLRCLMNYMPKSFSDCEVIPHELKNCTGVERDPHLSRRRNAICETSDDTRVKFYEALSAFLTLKAMAKYDFI